MGFIIKTENNVYFAGWNSFGEMTFIDQEEYAYRMRKPLAIDTADKIVNYTNGNCIIIDLQTRKEVLVDYSVKDTHIEEVDMEIA